jgi:hypothetical protein
MLRLSPGMLRVLQPMSPEMAGFVAFVVVVRLWWTGP